MNPESFELTLNQSLTLEIIKRETEAKGCEADLVELIADLTRQNMIKDNIISDLAKKC